MSNWSGKFLKVLMKGDIFGRSSFKTNVVRNKIAVVKSDKAVLMRISAFSYTDLLQVIDLPLLAGPGSCSQKYNDRQQELYHQFIKSSPFLKND